MSDNIANINDASPTSGPAFQARYVQAQAADRRRRRRRVRSPGVQLGNATGRVVHEPDNPLADKDGNVRYPDIDLGDQMGQLMMAQRGYQANLRWSTGAKDAYEARAPAGEERMTISPIGPRHRPSAPGPARRHADRQSASGAGGGGLRQRRSRGSAPV